MIKRTAPLLFLLAILVGGLIPLSAAAFGEVWHEVPIGAGVPPPQLVSPSDGAVLSSNIVSFQWENEAPATSYYLQVNDTADFSSPNQEFSGLTGLQKTVTLSSGTWYWRMRQYRLTPGATTGAWSSWSEVWSFTIQGGGQQTTTVLALEPSTFEVISGGSKSFTATLTADGSSLSGKSISWSASSGTLSVSSSTTDSSGKTYVTLTAPETKTTLQIQITASFAGDSSYLQSSAQASGSVVPLTPSSLASQVRDTMVSIGFENSKISPEIALLENALSDGYVGAIANLIGGTQETTFKQSTVENVIFKDVEKGAQVKIEVSASGSGRTFVFNFSSDVLSGLKEVWVDNQKISGAGSYSDALNPIDENSPEFFELRGGSGIQVLVSIPSFSTHTITLVAQPSGTSSLVWAAVAVVFLLIIVAVARRKPSQPPREEEAPSQPQEEISSEETRAAEETGAVKCPACGRLNSPHAKFCGYCGAPLKETQQEPSQQPAPLEKEEEKPQEEATKPEEPKICPSCGFKNRPGAEFCGKCGRKL